MSFLVLYSWPLIALTFFARYRMQLAVILGVLMGYLMLPTIEGVDLPILPPLDKSFMTGIALLLIAMMMASSMRQADALAVQPGWVPQQGVILGLICLLFASDFATALTNGEAARVGGRVLQGLQPYDGFSSALSSLVLISPLLLGRKFLAHPAAHLLLLKALAVAAALYALLALFEVRMSPQLNQMIYGFFPHSWGQHFRGGSWRPIVFLSHGLMVGLFFCCAALAALAAYRATRDQLGKRYLWIGLWVLFTLMMCSTFGAFGIALLLVPIVLLLKARTQVLCAAMIAGIVLTYPTLRMAGLVPTERVLSYAAQINVERAGSLKIRLDNEEAFLDRVAQKPLFGWGGWGRARIYNDLGWDITIADGAWIITYAVGGWARYIGLFGLLCLPILVLALRRKTFEPDFATAGLCVVLAANLVDTIPNSGINPITMLIAGALAGRLELRGKMALGEENEQAPEDVAPRLRYTRHPHMHNRSAQGNHRNDL